MPTGKHSQRGFGYLMALFAVAALGLLAATAGQGQITGGMLLMQRMQQGKERLLVSHLNGSRQILVLLFQRLVRVAGRAEQIDQRGFIKQPD